MTKPRLIIGMSGASGSIYAVRLLQCLKLAQIPTHLVVSKTAQLTCAIESKMTLNELKSLTEEFHPVTDLAATIASGSFQTSGMIIAPCSVSTLAAIATGSAENLLTRAADVVLKERRRLVLMVRETPLHLGHLRNMVQATEMGAIIAPPVPAFYNAPQTIEHLVDNTVGRILDLFNIEVGLVKRWKEHASI